MKLEYEEYDEEEKKLFRANKKRSTKGAEDIEQLVSESSEQFQIDRLLQNFNPNEFLVPPTLQESMYVYLLKLRSNLPMYTTMFMIYGMCISYLITYLLPLLIKSYNDRFEFLVEDPDRAIRIYSKYPSPLYWIFIFLPF